MTSAGALVALALIRSESLEQKPACRGQRAQSSRPPAHARGGLGCNQLKS